MRRVADVKGRRRRCSLLSAGMLSMSQRSGRRMSRRAARGLYAFRHLRGSLESSALSLPRATQCHTTTERVRAAMLHRNAHGSGREDRDPGRSYRATFGYPDKWKNRVAGRAPPPILRLFDKEKHVSSTRSEIGVSLISSASNTHPFPCIQSRRSKVEVEVEDQTPSGCWQLFT